MLAHGDFSVGNRPFESCFLLNYFVAHQVPRLVTVVKHGVRGVGYNFWLY